MTLLIEGMGISEVTYYALIAFNTKTWGYLSRQRWRKKLIEIGIKVDDGNACCWLSVLDSQWEQLPLPLAALLCLRGLAFDSLADWFSEWSQAGAWAHTLSCTCPPCQNLGLPSGPRVTKGGQQLAPSSNIHCHYLDISPLSDWVSWPVDTSWPL